MKFRRWELIVLLALLVFIIVFGLMNSIWSGFAYFTTVFILVFVGFFVNNRIYYIKFLKNEYDMGLDTYLAELYNNNLITKDQFDKKDERVVNGYYQGYRRSKSITISLIVILILVSTSVSLVQFGIW